MTTGDAEAGNKQASGGDDLRSLGEQPVRVAVNIRPLIHDERLEGCTECTVVTPGEPQVSISSKSFTFDNVYGGNCGQPSEKIFGECVQPLVEGLFQGYNATVFAYGQTGSGKTYTMGTAYGAGGSSQSEHGIVPLAMQLMWAKLAKLQDTETLVRVSFIEIHKEEIRDLLDPVSSRVPGKAPINIRELPGGGICLAGVKEIEVACLGEMIECLRQGSLCRQTSATSMNAHSSRSHAIFSITLEQRRIKPLNMRASIVKMRASLDGLASAALTPGKGDGPTQPDGGADAGPDEDEDSYLCSKLHLVDLAGSERAKKTKAQGEQMKEGIKINQGLLALSNVISALGDERKKNSHVPYRDSKLTRLLQDSLGGNSRTVMIACVSPADKNFAESLNTLKWANRARNIKNKPMVNRNDTSAEISKLRNQVRLLQAELVRLREQGALAPASGTATTTTPFSSDSGSCHGGNSTMPVPGWEGGAGEGWAGDKELLEELQGLRRECAELEVQLAHLNVRVAEAEATAEAEARRALQAELERDALRLGLEERGLMEADVSVPDSDKMGVIAGHVARIQRLEEQLRHYQGMGMGSNGGAAQGSGDADDDDRLLEDEETEGKGEETDAGLTSDYPETDAATDQEGDAPSVQVEQIKARQAATEDKYKAEQETNSNELQRLATILREKEAQMRKVSAVDTNFSALKGHYERVLKEMDAERSTLQRDREDLLKRLQELSSSKEEEKESKEAGYKQKLAALEIQLSSLKKKMAEHERVIKQKQKAEEQAKKLQAEIEVVKRQKVQVQKKMKVESESFLAWKASSQKEMLQLRKQSRKNQYELHRLEAQNQKQQLVLKRKQEEAAQAHQRLRQVLGQRKRLHKTKSEADEIKFEMQMQEWVEKELENIVHLQTAQRALQSEMDRRSSLAKKRQELKALLAATQPQATDGQGSGQGQESAAQASLAAELREIESSLMERTQAIARLQSKAVSLSECHAAHKAGGGEWGGMKSVKDAKALLTLLLNCTATAKCELQERNRKVDSLEERLASLETQLESMHATQLQQQQQQACTAQASESNRASPQLNHVGGGALLMRQVSAVSASSLSLTQTSSLSAEESGRDREDLPRGDWPQPVAVEEAGSAHVAPARGRRNGAAMGMLARHAEEDDEVVLGGYSSAEDDTPRVGKRPSTTAHPAPHPADARRSGHHVPHRASKASLPVKAWEEREEEREDAAGGSVEEEDEDSDMVIVSSSDSEEFEDGDDPNDRDWEYTPEIKARQRLLSASTKSTVNPRRGGSFHRSKGGLVGLARGRSSSGRGASSDFADDKENLGPDQGGADLFPSSIPHAVAPENGAGSTRVSQSIKGRLGRQSSGAAALPGVRVSRATTPTEDCEAGQHEGGDHDHAGHKAGEGEEEERPDECKCRGQCIKRCPCRGSSKSRGGDRRYCSDNCGCKRNKCANRPPAKVTVAVAELLANRRATLAAEGAESAHVVAWSEDGAVASAVAVASTISAPVSTFASDADEEEEDHVREGDWATHRGAHARACGGRPAVHPDGAKSEAAAGSDGNDDEGTPGACPETPPASASRGASEWWRRGAQLGSSLAAELTGKRSPLGTLSLNCGGGPSQDKEHASSPARKASAKKRRNNRMRQAGQLALAEATMPIEY
eukprot:jgi/Mesvir1/6201/Mv00884-RA.2